MEDFEIGRRGVLLATVAGSTFGVTGCMGSGDREQRKQILRLDRDARNEYNGDLNSALLEAHGHLDREEAEPAANAISIAIDAAQRGKEHASSAIDLTYEIEHEGATDAREIEEDVEEVLTLMGQGLREMKDGIESWQEGSVSQARHSIQTGGSRVQEARRINPRGPDVLATVLDLEIPSGWEYEEWQGPSQA